MLSPNQPAHPKPQALDCEIFPETVLPVAVDRKQLEEMIEQLGADAFGPGRFTRAAFRLREGRPCDPVLSFTAWAGGELVGSVRQTPILIGDRKALVLGPLVVLPSYKNTGVGSLLMRRAVEAARTGNHELIILVGDEPYYAKFGFKRVPHKQILLPGPADPARILYCELEEGAIRKFNGMAMQA